MTARGDPIGGAKVFRAHPRSASDHSLLAVVRSFRIIVSRLRVIIIRIPIGAPFPDVARYVIEPDGVRRKALDGSATDETIFTGISIGKVALPPVGHRLTAGA